MKKSSIPERTRKDIDAYYDIFMNICMKEVVHGRTSQEYLDTRKKLFNHYIDMMNKIYLHGCKDALVNKYVKGK